MYTGRQVGDIVPSENASLLSLVAWGVLFLTTGPLILTATFGGTRPSWVIPAQFATAVCFLLLTTMERFRPLQSFALAVLAAICTFQVRLSWVSIIGLTVPSGIWSQLATNLLQHAFVLGLIVILLLTGKTRERLFLRLGDPASTVSRSVIPGLRRDRKWWEAALLWGGIPGALLFVFSAATGQYSLPGGIQEFGYLLILVSLAVIVNAFNEEVIFRAAPLADLVEAIGKTQALLLLGAYFGLFHYFGSPGGVVGVLMTGFYAWILAKCIFETRGLLIALVIHFTADFLIYWTYIS
ncbi:CPBP family intramembrane glutamic endopeptidase [Halorussus halobius]|uniref:CPBP family intramembrane glutamic endopeptidase n=1 Tax=Halorussus halobius TaxID=1710537 RepID=UPI0010923F33|nr:CPBP family intramembrane glutamic endopeptidase [Halorussus halobius]